VIEIGNIQRYRKNWDFDYPGIQQISISDHGNACAASTKDNKILWFDGDSGFRWKVPLEYRINDIKTAGLGNHVVVATNKGFFKIDQSGQVVWNHPTPKPALAVTVNHFGTQITGTTEDRRIHTLNSSGKLIETQKVKDKLLDLTTSGSDEFLLCRAKSDVYLLDAQGHPLWNYKTIFGANEVAFSHKGNFFVAGGLDTVFCMTNDKQILWKTTAIGKVTAISIPASDDGVVVSFNNGIVQYIDMKGSIKWQFKYGSNILDAKASGNGKFLMVSTSERSIVFTNNQGQMLWSIDLANSQRHVAMSSLGVKLYCASQKNISCFENLLAVPDQYNAASQALKQLEALGAQVDKAKASLQQAKTAISQQQMEIGSNISRQIFNAANNQRHKLVVQKMGEVQRSIKAKAKEGVDVSDALAQYKRMQKSLAVRDYNPVIEGINTTESRLAESEARQEAKAFEDRFLSLNQMIKDAEAEGLDVQLLQHRFQQIRTLYGNGEKDEAQKNLKELEVEANNTLRSYHQKKVQEGLESLNGAMEGFSDGSIRDQLDSTIAQVRYQMEQGNLLDARGMINEGLKFLEEARKNRKVYDAISSAEENLTKAREYGMDVDKHEASLTEVKNIVEEGNLTHAFTVVRSVSIELEKMVRDREIFQRNMEDFQTNFDTLQGLVSRASGMGQDTAQLDMNLEQARSFAEKGAFQKADERLDKISRMLERMGVSNKSEGSDQASIPMPAQASESPGASTDTSSHDGPMHKVPQPQVPEKTSSPPSDKSTDSPVQEVVKSQSLDEQPSDSGPGDGGGSDLFELGTVPQPSTGSHEGASPGVEKTCPNCSADIPPGFAFCGKCGTKIG